jgi:RHS repeat-associated protein
MLSTCGLGLTLVSMFMLVTSLDFAGATGYKQMQAIDQPPATIPTKADTFKKPREAPKPRKDTIGAVNPPSTVRTALRQRPPVGRSQDVQTLGPAIGVSGGSSPEFQADYDAANEMIRHNSPTPNLTYDSNGNLTSQTDQFGTATYIWNARNQLVAVIASGLDASFAYDAFGRRIRKTINGETTEYQYDGAHVVAEIQGGVVRATYLRIPQTGEPLIRTLSDGSHEYYLLDALGSTLALTDDTGAVKTRYFYDEFGNVTITGAPSTNPFQYTGQENDGATGLYYYKARYYSPKLRRFLSEDPIGISGGDTNLYAYVRNNPVNLVDPDGQRFGLPPRWFPPEYFEPKSGGRETPPYIDPRPKIPEPLPPPPVRPQPGGPLADPKEPHAPHDPGCGVSPNCSGMGPPLIPPLGGTQSPGGPRLGGRKDGGPQGGSKYPLPSLPPEWCPPNHWCS